uniref:Mariner Mos1 transposase n=1 Tax=Heterorhabditis bacteriophora TaxID=37862 RepID=A0A1I7X4T9_HETBA
MGRASTLRLHERGQIKALSTAGYTVKRIADVVKRSRKATKDVLRVGFTFQQDNATIHATRSTETWLEENDVATLDCPSRSPDLSPMENL